jgi:hypothetical protein
MPGKQDAFARWARTRRRLDALAAQHGAAAAALAARRSAIAWAVWAVLTAALAAAFTWAWLLAPAPTAVALLPPWLPRLPVGGWWWWWAPWWGAVLPAAEVRDVWVPAGLLGGGGPQWSGNVLSPALMLLAVYGTARRCAAWLEAPVPAELPAGGGGADHEKEPSQAGIWGPESAALLAPPPPPALD